MINGKVERHGLTCYVWEHKPYLKIEELFEERMNTPGGGGFKWEQTGKRSNPSYTMSFKSKELQFEFSVYQDETIAGVDGVDNFHGITLSHHPPKLTSIWGMNY